MTAGLYNYMPSSLLWLLLMRTQTAAPLLVAAVAYSGRGVSYCCISVG